MFLGASERLLRVKSLRWPDGCGNSRFSQQGKQACGPRVPPFYAFIFTLPLILLGKGGGWSGMKDPPWGAWGGGCRGAGLKDALWGGGGWGGRSEGCPVGGGVQLAPAPPRQCDVIAHRQTAATAPFRQTFQRTTLTSPSDSPPISFSKNPNSL